MKLQFIFLLCVLFMGNTISQAQTPEEFPNVPGTVIYHSPASTGKFPGSPTICILPNGNYLAACDLFGKEVEESNHPKTLIFESKDQGKSWQQKSIVKGCWWSGFFYHNHTLYLMGTSKEYGNCVIRKSTDHGKTWSDPTDESHGLLFKGDYERGFHTAPTAVTIHNGRVWRGMETAPTKGNWGNDFRMLILSAPVDADLLQAKNWTKSNELAFDKNWKPYCNTWLEGNTVVDPTGNIKVMLRVDYRKDNHEKAALVTVSPDGKKVSFSPSVFIDFPGGCKKFTVRYDSVSQKYWALSNYIPDEYLTGKPPIIERGRNTQALCSSTDLRNWTVNTIYLQHPDIYKHGFQYTDWLIEGEDLVVVSRTAFEDGLGGAENCHNANFLTFHRIKNFRNLTMADRYKIPTEENKNLKITKLKSQDLISRTLSQ